MALGVKVVDVLPAVLGDDPGPDPEGDVLVLRFGSAEGLAVPATPAPVAAPIEVDEDHHVVAAGETLSSIAAARLGDPALALDLAELNGLSDPDRLEVGQVLRLR